MKSAIILTTMFSCIALKNVFGISIPEAVRQNLISITVHGRDWSPDSIYHSSHYGQCISFDIKNLTSTSIQLTEDAGRFLMPEDSNNQRMVLTSAMTMTLPGHQQKSIAVFAMCSEAHDAAPSKRTIFSYGKMAEGKLLALVKMISKNKFQDAAAQSAIWSVTDDLSPYNIYSGDTSETNKLTRYVCTLKNIRYEAGKNHCSGCRPQLVHITGYFDYTIDGTHKIDIRIFNEQNKLVKDIVRGEEQTSGSYAYWYETDIPVNGNNLRTVTVRLYIDGKLFAKNSEVLPRLFTNSE